jgi:hypothetical protein
MYKQKSLTRLNFRNDTIVFIQYNNGHTANFKNICIINRKVYYNKNYFIDGQNQLIKDFFPYVFIEAVKCWDTAYLYSLPTKKGYHTANTYISRIIKGKVEVLKPKIYDFANITNQTLD